jgi:hypothetical protein
VFDAASKTVSIPIERSLALFGEPNAYIIGGELSGSFVLGGRHGSGELRFSDGVPTPVTWSALSVGIGLGADYGRVIMLVYGLDRREDVFGTYCQPRRQRPFPRRRQRHHPGVLAGPDRADLVGPRPALLSGDLSRIVIEPAGPPEQLRPPGMICATPADCAAPGR